MKDVHSRLENLFGETLEYLWRKERHELLIGGCSIRAAFQEWVRCIGH